MEHWLPCTLVCASTLFPHTPQRQVTWGGVGWRKCQQAYSAAFTPTQASLLFFPWRWAYNWGRGVEIRTFCITWHREEAAGRALSVGETLQSTAEGCLPWLLACKWVIWQPVGFLCQSMRGIGSSAAAWYAKSCYTVTAYLPTNSKSAWHVMRLCPELGSSKQATIQSRSPEGRQRKDWWQFKPDVSKIKQELTNIPGN